MVVGGFERDGEIDLDLKNSEAVVGFNFENQWGGGADQVMVACHDRKRW